VQPDLTCLWTMPSVATSRPDVDRRNDVGGVVTGLRSLAAAPHAAEASAAEVLLESGRIADGAARHGSSRVSQGFRLACVALGSRIIRREANR
jgi:hypothetical protein